MLLFLSLRKNCLLHNLIRHLSSWIKLVKAVILAVGIQNFAKPNSSMIQEVKAQKSAKALLKWKSNRKLLRRYNTSVWLFRIATMA